MKIITGSSKVVQGTGDTKSATVSYEFGVKGSEQKRVRDRSIGQGTVPAFRPFGEIIVGCESDAFQVSETERTTNRESIAVLRAPVLETTASRDISCCTISGRVW